jgi:hypothetical protein
MPEIVSEVTQRATGGVGNSAAARPVISQAVTVGGAVTNLPSARDRGDRDAPAPGGTIQHEVRANAARPLPESARKLLEVLDRPADDKPAPAGDLKPAAATPAAPPATPPLGAPAQPAAPEAKAEPEKQPAAAPHAAELERVLAQNRALTEEVGRLKTAPRHEPSPRDKALDEIERTYLENPRASVRRLIAVALGHEDPKHPDVDSEMKGLLQELFSDDAGVPIDDTRQAKIEAARTRHLLARDKRQRTAEQAAASAPPESSEDKQTAADTQVLSNLLDTHKVDGKSFAERYPLMMSVSQKVHGIKPADLLRTFIYEGFATGEYDRAKPAGELIELAAKRAEALYQDLHDTLGRARPTSTAQPTTAPEIANKEGQGQAPRSITNASASVAPATPPAKPDTSAPPKRYRTTEEKRLAIIQRHTGER